jgi:hypothetical protein
MLIYEQCKICPVFLAKQEELLKTSDSVYDAIYDHQQFLQDCMKTCQRLVVLNPTEHNIK